MIRLEPEEIRQFEKGAALGVYVVAASASGSRALSLKQRPVSGMEDRSGDEFVRCHEIREHSRTRAVVLQNRAQEEMSVKLVDGPGVDDVDRIDSRAAGNPVEPNASVGNVLTEFFVGLQHGFNVTGARVS